MAAGDSLPLGFVGALPPAAAAPLGVSPMSTRFLRRVVPVTACLPAAWVVLLGLLVLRTRAIDGASLYPMAKFTPFSVHFTLTQILFVAFPFLAIGSAAHILWVRRHVPGFRSFPAFLLLGVCVGLCLATIAINPGGRFLWFFD